MKAWLAKNRQIITYAFVILGLVWLILVLLTLAAEFYKQFFKVDPDDGVLTALEKVGEVANMLLDLVVPLVLIALGLLLAPFVAGAALFVCGVLIVAGLIGVGAVLFGWFGKGSKSEKDLTVK